MIMKVCFVVMKEMVKVERGQWELEMSTNCETTIFKLFATLHNKTMKGYLCARYPLASGREENCRVECTSII